MTACKTKLYVNKDVDWPLTIPSDAGFTDTDISELEVTLTLDKDPLQTVTYKKSLGEITIVSATDITVHIKKGDITTPGYYMKKIDMTDTSAGDRGISPCPDRLYFSNQ